MGRAREIIDGLSTITENVPRFNPSSDSKCCKETKSSVHRLCRERPAIAEFAEGQITLFWLPLLDDHEVGVDVAFKELCMCSKFTKDVTNRVSLRPRSSSRESRRREKRPFAEVDRPLSDFRGPVMRRSGHR